MLDPFLLKLALSFIVGGCWIILVTILAEKAGPKVGGFIAGLPSTIILGLFFIGWTQSPLVAVQATGIVPLIAGINCLFILVYSVMVRRSFFLSLICSLLVWGLLSFGSVLMGLNNFVTAMIVFACLFSVSYYFLKMIKVRKSRLSQKMKYTPAILAVRGLFGGVVISLTVIMTKVGGPSWGGLFSMFPAMFLSTLIITYLARGAAFSAEVMKITMLSSVSIVMYAGLVRIVYGPLGFVWGTIVSILVAYGFGLVMYQSIIKKAS